MRRLLAIAAIPLVLASGCTYHRTIYSPLRPEDSPSGQTLHRFTMIRARTVYPFHDHEWDLNLAIPQSMVREGMEVRFPSDSVAAVFSEWHHREQRVLMRPTGTVRFVQIRPDAVQAQVDMHANVPSGWRVQRLVWFRYDPMAATEMPWVRDSTSGNDDQ